MGGKGGRQPSPAQGPGPSVVHLQARLPFTRRRVRNHGLENTSLADAACGGEHLPVHEMVVGLTPPQAAGSLPCPSVCRRQPTVSLPLPSLSTVSEKHPLVRIKK